MPSASSASLSSASTSATLVAPVNGGPVMATANIINQKADASRSLYQICVNLRERLRRVPDFEAHLSDSDDDDREAKNEESLDPVSSLWRCLRKGDPLMTIYNVLDPAVRLEIDGTTALKTRPKKAAFKFLQACLQELHIPPGDCCTIQDLFGDDTTGFVKVGA